MTAPCHKRSAIAMHICVQSSFVGRQTNMNCAQPKAVKRPRFDDDNANCNGTKEAASACAPTAGVHSPSAASPSTPAPAAAYGATTNNFCQALTTELVVRALGYLGVHDILQARVCRSLGAASKLVTPSDGLVVHNEALATNLEKCGRDVLPKVEEVRIATKGIYFSDLWHFKNLKRLSISPHLRSESYPILFTLHRLERLDVELGPLGNFRCNLSDIARLTNLREFRLQARNGNAAGVIGNVSSLSTLQKLTYLRMDCVSSVEGNVLSLAELPSLSLMDLRNCSNISGDVQDIEPHHFPSLKILKIEATGIYGRPGTQLMSIDDASVLFAAWRRVISQPRPLSTIEGGKMQWAELHRSSPDYYAPGRWTVFARHPPFTATMIRVGQRVGYRWRNKSGQACDVCWLDPEPSSDNANHETYWASLYQLEQAQLHSIYKGHNRPPSQEEWQQIARI